MYFQHLSVYSSVVTIRQAKGNCKHFMRFFGDSAGDGWFVAKFYQRDGGIMIQCKDCEMYEDGEDGKRTFKCDPFSNIKEPECLAKWQLIRLDMLVASYQSMLQWYGKLAPIQDKLFKYMEREIEDIDESEKWKVDDDDLPDI